MGSSSLILQKKHGGIYGKTEKLTRNEIFNRQSCIQGKFGKVCNYKLRITLQEMVYVAHLSRALPI